MPTVLLTTAAVSKIAAPPKPKQVDYWDSKIAGLGLRISYNGARTWLVMTHVLKEGKWKKARVKLGRFPEMTLKDARIKAQEVKVNTKLGHDPRETKKKVKAKIESESRDTFKGVRERFIRQHCQHLKKSTAKEYARALRSETLKPLEDKAISSITKREIVEVIDSKAETAPIAANRVLNYLKVMMNWAADKDIIAHPPTDRIRPPARERSRDRVLSDIEICVAWKVFDKDPIFGPIFKLLLLTGARRSEVGNMIQSELDLNASDPVWIIPSSRTKNGIEHRVPITPLFLEIIRSIPRTSNTLMFSTNGTSPVSGWTRAKNRSKSLIAKTLVEEGIENAFDKDWSYHDLRRTMATHLAEMGVKRDIVELLINHRSGSRRGIVSVYNRSELLSERRKALLLWSNRIQNIVSGKKGPNNVLQMK